MPFRHGVAGMQIDGRWGFIDGGGSFVVKPVYDDLHSFAEGYAPLRRNGKWGLINLNGALAVDYMFEELGELAGGIAQAKLDGKSGIVSATGSWVIRPDFDRCYRFFGRLAVVCKYDSYSYLRRTGEVLWTSDEGAMVQSPPFVP